MARPSEAWLDAEGPGAAFFDLIDLRSLDESYRFQLPAPARACVSWLHDFEGGRVVVEICEVGRIRIHPWDPLGNKISTLRQQLAKSDEAEDREQLIFLTERYRGVNMEKSARLPLRERELFHLGLSSSTGWKIYLLCVTDYIEFWSEAYRREWRALHQVYSDNV